MLVLYGPHAIGIENLQVVQGSRNVRERLERMATLKYGFCKRLFTTSPAIR